MTARRLSGYAVLPFLLSACVVGTTGGVIGGMSYPPATGSRNPPPGGTPVGAATGPHAEPAPTAEPGPPPWAPAHGRRRKDAFRYVYYREAQVYHDADRSLYFHLDLATGAWQATATLPSGITLSSESGVELDMTSDKPYERHEEITKQYPPGQAKKKDKKKKGKGPK